MPVHRDCLFHRSRTLQCCLIIALLIFQILTFPARAQEPQPSESPSPAQEPPPPGHKTIVNYYLQGNYEVNQNYPASELNDFRYLDTRANFISPDLFEILINDDPDRGCMGYRLKATYGEIARRIHARGLGTFDDLFDPTEFVLMYKVPMGTGLKMEAGKMNTHIGGEVLESIYDMNYTRAFLFTYGEPTTHTGLRLTYSFSPQFSVLGHITNGWDNFSDNNGGKCLGLSINYFPSESVGLYFNVLNGPEQDNNSIDNRFLFDWIGTFKISKRLTLLANYDFGREQNYLGTGSDAEWNGLILSGNYEFNDFFSLGLRGETFSDPQGYRTGTPQTLREITLSPQFKVSKNMVIRPEYRCDWSDVKSFNEGTSNNQSTIGIGVMILF